MLSLLVAITNKTNHDRDPSQTSVAVEQSENEYQTHAAVAKQWLKKHLNLPDAK